MAYGDWYWPGDGVESALMAAISHTSELHFFKNLTAFIIGSVILIAYARWWDIPLLLVPGAIAGNVVHAIAFADPAMGASGGTFAMLGAAAAVAVRRHPVLTVVGYAPLLVHQTTVADVSVAWIHGAAFVAGILYAGIVGPLRRRVSER